MLIVSTVVCKWFHVACNYVEYFRYKRKFNIIFDQNKVTKISY